MANISIAIEAVKQKCGAYPLAVGRDTMTSANCKEPGELVQALADATLIEHPIACDPHGAPYLMRGLTTAVTAPAGDCLRFGTDWSADWEILVPGRQAGSLGQDADEFTVRYTTVEDSAFLVPMEAFFGDHDVLIAAVFGTKCDCGRPEWELRREDAAR